MAFTLRGFQRNAFQMLTNIRVGATEEARKLNQRLRRNTRIKARADYLAEKYRLMLERKLEAEALKKVEEVVKPFTRETKLEDVYDLPKIETIDFEAIASDAKARGELLQLMKKVMLQQEEEIALILILAAM